MHEDTDLDLLFGGANIDWLFYKQSEDIAYGALGDMFKDELFDFS